ncbi:MAG: hypothetical protein ABIG39_04325 [Candidatus Micrarchaeota archaeon]
MKKAFVFTIDSFIALILALFAMSAMLFISSAPTSNAPSYARMYLLADDGMNVLSTVKLNAVRRTVSDENETLIIEIGRLISVGDSIKAGEIAGWVLEPIIPEQFGFSVEYMDSGDWVGIYLREGRETRMRASSVRIVAGALSDGDVGPEWCYNEDCASCSGTPQGYVEGEMFGPLLLRVSIWV